jgi:hypothetical protein
MWLNPPSLTLALGGAVKKSMFSSIVNILLSYIGLVYKKCGKDWEAIMDELH